MKLLKSDLRADAYIYQWAWSPDGNYIVHRWTNEENKSTFFVASVDRGDSIDTRPAEDMGRWLSDPVWIDEEAQ